MSEQKKNWRDWLQERQKSADMDCQRVSLGQVSDWGIVEGGFYGRPDGAFFRLIGASITNATREVEYWGQVLLEELGEPNLVVLVKDQDGKALLKAESEPGNPTPGRVLIRPSLQVSISNLEQAHGGEKPKGHQLLQEFNRDELIPGHTKAHSSWVFVFVALLFSAQFIKIIVIWIYQLSQSHGITKMRLSSS